MPEFTQKIRTLVMLMSCISFAQVIHAETTPSTVTIPPQIIRETSAPPSGTVAVDAKPPVSRIEIASPKYTNEKGKVFVSAATAIALRAEDDASGVAHSEYRITGGAWVGYREPFTIENEGDHKLEFRSVDNAGNSEEIKRIQLVSDSTPPISAFTPLDRTCDSSEICYINAPLHASVTATDRFSGVQGSEYRIDGGEWRKHAQFTVDDTKNHLISFRSTDNLGNMETPRTVPVYIDKTAPATTITVGDSHLEASKGVQTVTDSTFFTLSSRDTLSGVSHSEYRIDGGDWLRYEPFTIQEGGRHAIEYRSNDKAGNRETARSLTVMVDTLPPLTVASVDNKPLEAGSSHFSAHPLKITLTATDKSAGIKMTEYKLNSGPWRQYQPFSVSNQGTHLIEYRSTDQLDTIEPTRFIKVILDSTPPLTSLIVGEPKEDDQGVIRISDRTVLSLYAHDELSGTDASQYVITGRGERKGSEPFTIATPGEYEIRYWSSDRVGNREPEKITRIQVVIPKSAPDEIPVAEKTASGTEQRTENSDIPESIRLPSKDQATASQSVMQGNSAIPDGSGPYPAEMGPATDESVYQDGFMGRKPTQSEGSSNRTRAIPAKELLGVGGINALIIGLIFLVL